MLRYYWLHYILLHVFLFKSVIKGKDKDGNKDKDIIFQVFKTHRKNM